MVLDSLNILVQLMRISMRAFRCRELVNSVYSLAKLQFCPPEIFVEACPFLCRLEDQMTSHDVANLVWAYSTASVPNENLLQILERKAAALSTSMRLKELASILYGFANMQSGSPELFSVLAERARRSTQWLNPQEMYNIAW
eukprot:scaffold374912_cov33-Prasinocladus_malaysianus.AAC.1